MFDRGLGLDPNLKDEDGNLINFNKEDEFFDTEDRTAIDQFLALEQPDQPDELHRAFLGRANLLSPQPYERDIHWIQIEDFVDVFNRVLQPDGLYFREGRGGATGRDQEVLLQVVAWGSPRGQWGPSSLVLAPEIDEDNMSALEKRKRDLQRTLANAEKGLKALKAKEDPTPVAADNNGGNVDKDFINQAYDEDLDEELVSWYTNLRTATRMINLPALTGTRGKTLKARMGRRTRREEG